jgi:hypothetical protein
MEAAVLATGALVLATYAWFGCTRLTDAQRRAFRGDIAAGGVFTAWSVSALLTVVAYLVLVADLVSNAVAYALVVFNLTAAAFTPTILLAADPETAAVAPVAATALASTIVAALVFAAGAAVHLVLAAAWLVVQHVVVDLFVWSGALRAVHDYVRA